ncbi:MAG: hypothetical protein C0P78_007450 [Bacillota bacterium]
MRFTRDERGGRPPAMRHDPRPARPAAAVAAVLAALLLAACGGGGAAQQVVDVAVNHEVEINGLEIRIARVVVEPGGVLVDATVYNPGGDPRALLLGGCGPSQGRVSTGDGWKNVYYQVRPEGELGGWIQPGERRSGVIALKPAEELDPGSVTRVQIHPGYVLNTATGELELLQVMLSLEEGGA